MVTALRDMQDVYFERWVGTWPKGIDWTRAVMGTHIAATLRTISSEPDLCLPAEMVGYGTGKEDVISGYFADLIAYYFGEDAFALRNQAYDDMLWVVLGWLESIQFVDGHGAASARDTKVAGARGGLSWYGDRWIPAFAHRARVFWELAAKGWDTELCGGGMIWNPRLMPYKNAITNQLFIAASIGMYLYFPGDSNTSPFGRFGFGLDGPEPLGHPRGNLGWRPHDPVFGRAAQQGYRWLASSNMTNAQGLYADGFHISGHESGSNNTECDVRDEMVYTYNQGVILTGLLGLFQATGNVHYLREGHTLVQNVIRATGYDLSSDSPVDELDRLPPGHLPPWRGLGRAGILEEACDVWGSCSQDAQTFKGIWMHHFATFCSPTALEFIHPGAGLDERVKKHVRTRHAAECRRYVGWLRHNARAALKTRDEKGLFGMWWTAGLLRITTESLQLIGDVLPPDVEGADYRNSGVPQDPMWIGHARILAPGEHVPVDQKPVGGGGRRQQRVIAKDRTGGVVEKEDREPRESGMGDPNLRGRGRTLETQGGGLAVLRALWVVSKHEL